MVKIHYVYGEPGGKGGGGNSTVFHLSFLTQWARASGRLWKLAGDATVTWTSEVEEKLRS